MKNLLAISLLLLSASVFAQTTASSLPKQQEDFQDVMNGMPTVPQELINKREGEPYLEKVDKFKSEWDFGFGKAKSKSPKISLIKDWLCSVNGAGDGKEKLKAINCKPLNMKRASIFLKVKTPKVDKLYKGDIIKVSGKVSEIMVSNPVSDVNYALKLNDATYELVSKGQ
jgi:hypothetical protein